MENIKEKIEKKGLNYEYFIEESKSITRELEQGKTGYLSEAYIKEKINHILSMFEEENEY